MEQHQEESLVLNVAVKHLKTAGEWPELQDIHRRIHQELGEQVDVPRAARRLAPKPFVGGGYSYLGETFSPPLDVLARDPEGYGLLEAVVEFITLAQEKYRSAKGQPEITAAEFSDLRGVDTGTSRAIRELLHSTPSVTNGSSGGEEWNITIADEIVGWPIMSSPDGLLAELARRQHRRISQAADIADGKYRLLEATGRVRSTVGSTSPSDEAALSHSPSSGTHSRFITTVLIVAAVLGGGAALLALIEWATP